MKTLFTPLLQKFPIIFQALGTKKAAVLAPVAVVPIVISVKWSLVLFFGCFLGDFITGVLAAYIAAKKEKLKTETEFSRMALFTETISSEKLRKSGVKLFFYISTVFLVRGVEIVFLIEPVGFAKISKAVFPITTVVIALWIVFELYSIIFENFKKMGIDVSLKISNIFKKVKSIKNEIKL